LTARAPAPLSTSACRLFALLAAAFVCTHATTDPDLWGHLKFGLDAVHSRSLTAVDPYSFTQNVPWINHEWLSEVVQALVYRGGGVTGLVVMKAALLAAAFAVLMAATRRAADPYRWWLLGIAIVSVAPAAYTIRPQLWTLIGVPALWLMLERRRSLPWVPVLFAAWANLHGGWIVGAAIAALWLAGRALDTRRLASALPAGIALIAAIAATLINPYGWSLWRFLASTVRISRSIGEWRPLWQQQDVSFGLLWVVVVAGIVVPAMRRRQRIAWASAIPVAWLGVMSVFVTRLVPFFGEVAALALAGVWQRRTPGPSAAGNGAAIERNAGGADLIDVAAFTAVALVNIIPQARCLDIQGRWAPDVVAAAAFRPSSVQGRLVLPFDWGEYAIWHWGPRLRVSMDGRRETVYSEKTIDVQSAVARGLPEGLEYLRRVRPEYVWLRSASVAPATEWMSTLGYRLDVTTDESFIATRADLPPVVAGPPMSRCFP
jgi:hypothetical protein